MKLPPILEPLARAVRSRRLPWSSAAGRRSAPAELPVVDFGPDIGEYVSEEPSSRYPIYTRGSVGEMWPEVVYPLTVSLNRREGVTPMLKPMLASGVVRKSDLVDDVASVGGVFGGYQYTNLSFNRMLGERMFGVSAEQSDAIYLGHDGVAPPYEPHPGDRNRFATLRGLRYGLRSLTTRELPVLDADRELVDGWEQRLPELLAGADGELVAVGRELAGPMVQLLAHHTEISGQANRAVQVLAGICEDRLGDRSLVLPMLGGLGDVDSAAPSFELWRLGRMAAANPTIGAYFDDGIEGLEERLRDDALASQFMLAFDNFLAWFGSRGPNEWEPAADTWGTDHRLALTLVDRMRLATDDRNPAYRAAALASEREAAISAARKRIGRAHRTVFDRAVRAAILFSRSRERSKTTVVDLIHVGRLVFRELGERTAARVEGGAVDDLWFVFDAELDEYVRDPAAFADTVERRRAAREQLVRREPPFVFDDEFPSPETWPLRGGHSDEPELQPGESLSGTAGCAGVAEGRARVVTHPGDPGDLGPGDVLVAPLTDSSWTPLFVPVEAIVVEVGRPMSHAMIVSRELGRPCVVAATDATRRIPDGARIRVDGTTGTVTLL